LKPHLYSCILPWDLPLAVPADVPKFCRSTRREVPKRKGRKDGTFCVMRKNKESSGNFGEGNEKLD